MKLRKGLIPAAAAAALLLAACAVSDDEAWFRITGFGGDVAVYGSELSDDSTDTVDVNLENNSSIVGTADGEGSDILVYRAEVSYDLGQYLPPRYEYPVTLSIPAESGEGGGTATLSDLPIVPRALKIWLLNPANLPAETSSGTFQMGAVVTLKARNEEGTQLETRGGLSLLINGAGAAGTATTTITTATDGGTGDGP